MPDGKVEPNESGLRRHAGNATPAEQATAFAVLVDPSTALEDPEGVREWGARLAGVECARVESAVTDPSSLRPWMP
jgi:hypothetical protein